jgi:hypothetical protein
MAERYLSGSINGVYGMQLAAENENGGEMKSYRKWRQ